jgi:hypothetical protein
MLLTGKSEILEAKPVSVLLCLPKISHELARNQNGFQLSGTGDHMPESLKIEHVCHI